jgi:hypothetical protein
MARASIRNQAAAVHNNKQQARGMAHEAGAEQEFRNKSR